MSVAPTYECDFGELSAWLLAGCLAAPLVAFPFTVTSALRVTNTVVVGFPLGFGLPLTVHLSTTTRLLR
jgi:hypothetical protein